MDHLMVSNRRMDTRKTKGVTSALPAFCRLVFLGNLKVVGEIRDWDDKEGDNWATGNHTHTTQHNITVVSCQFSVFVEPALCTILVGRMVASATARQGVSGLNSRSGELLLGFFRCLENFWKCARGFTCQNVHLCLPLWGQKA
uniref:SFRICE_030933 n=1 Tax=Spodoptera frugiperda TaxID=7108 RepID=A0A2H1WVW1_SPOFR